MRPMSPGVSSSRLELAPGDRVELVEVERHDVAGRLGAQQAELDHQRVAGGAADRRGWPTRRSKQNAPSSSRIAGSDSSAKSMSDPHAVRDRRPSSTVGDQVSSPCARS